MNDVLLNLIRQQKSERQAILAKGTVPREVASRMAKQLSSPLIKVIMGPRRVGKSTLAHQLLRDLNYAYFNFEDENLPPTVSGREIVEALDIVYPNHSLLLFDEIQNLPKWEPFLNRLHRSGKNLLITGSNSRLLSSELATSLTGRYLAVELFPFSYTEYLSAQKHPQAGTHFETYLLDGGFPDIVMHHANAREFLPTLWDSIVLQDIVQRYAIRRTAAVKNLLLLLLHSMANRVSGRSLERALQSQLSIATIHKFLDYAQSAYLGLWLHPFSYRARRRINAEKKVYLIDSGFFSSRKVGPFDDWPRLLENLVFVELFRRGYKPNIDLFYFQTAAGREVDFLLTDQGAATQLLQVSYSLGGPATREREFRALVEGARETGALKLTVITMREESQHAQDGYTIEVIPVTRWLTEGLR